MSGLQRSRRRWSSYHVYRRVRWVVKLVEKNFLNSPSSINPPFAWRSFPFEVLAHEIGKIFGNLENAVWISEERNGEFLFPLSFSSSSFFFNIWMELELSIRLKICKSFCFLIVRLISFWVTFCKYISCIPYVWSYVDRFYSFSVSFRFLSYFSLLYLLKDKTFFDRNIPRNFRDLLILLLFSRVVKKVYKFFPPPKLAERQYKVKIFLKKE